MHQVYSGVVRKGGHIALPPEISAFRVGQRVYFYVKGRAAVFQTKPSRATNGRLISSRIRRAVYSLAAFGPRTRHARRVSAKHGCLSDPLKALTAETHGMYYRKPLPHVQDDKAVPPPNSR